MSIYADIAALIDAINAAKDGGDYYTANILFAAALHFITRGGKLRERAPIWRRHFVIEMLYPNENEANYYDCLHIISESHRSHACIPVPMLRDDITKFAYAHSRRVERGVHLRDIDPCLPDTWSESMAGWLATGREAIPMFFSEDGRGEVAWLKGRRLGEETEESIDNEEVGE